MHTRGPACGCPHGAGGTGRGARYLEWRGLGQTSGRAAPLQTDHTGFGERGCLRYESRLSVGAGSVAGRKRYFAQGSPELGSQPAAGTPPFSPYCRRDSADGCQRQSQLPSTAQGAVVDTGTTWWWFGAVSPALPRMSTEHVAPRSGSPSNWLTRAARAPERSSAGLWHGRHFSPAREPDQGLRDAPRCTRLRGKLPFSRARPSFTFSPKTPCKQA